MTILFLIILTNGFILHPEKPPAEWVTSMEGPMRSSSALMVRMSCVWSLKSGVISRKN